MCGTNGTVLTAGTFFPEIPKSVSVSSVNPFIGDYQNFIFILPMFLWQVLGRDVARVATSIVCFFPPPDFIFSEWQIFGYWKEDIFNSHIYFLKKLKYIETFFPLPHNNLEAITLAMGTNTARYHILHRESFKGHINWGVGMEYSVVS